jgi:hypothetical protein
MREEGLQERQIFEDSVYRGCRNAKKRCEGIAEVN